MTERFYDEQIEGLIVNSVTGTHVDNSDPKHPKLPEFVLKSVYDLAMLNKANTDGSNTVGGTWYIDTILSDLFPNYKQVIRVLGGQMAIEYGNVQLDVHRFVVTSVNGLKVKVGSAEYTVFHSGNFNPDSKANTDGSNATGALAATIANNHTHANKSVLDSITAQDLIEWDDAAAKSHNAVTLGANAVGMDLNVSTQRLQFQNGYQLPTTIALSQYDEAFLMRHSHGNKSVLDNLTQSVIDNSHTHSNKALLDSYNQSNANISDAVSLRHSHINKAILDAITAAYTTADKNTLDALAGIQLEADQANALIRIKDGNGNVLSTLNVAFLNNEGTQFVYNPSNNTLDLINDYGQTLSSIPVSSFVTNLVSNANWNGTTPSRLDFKDNAGTILFSIDYSIANIQGLQNALDSKANVNGNNLTNISDWRNNLGVYSTTQVDGFLANKANTNHTHSYLTNWVDTRNTPTIPNDYDGRFEAKGIKDQSLYGLLGGGYANVFGYRGWNDNSGGNAIEFVIPYNGNDLYFRTGDTTSWDNLHKFWHNSNFDPNTKANTSGYYSGLSVGNADNATMWNGQRYDQGAVNNIDVFMTNNGNGWGYSTVSQMQSALGITTALNLNLQQVTNNGNSTTNTVQLRGGANITDLFFKDNTQPLGVYFGSETNGNLFIGKHSDYGYTDTLGQIRYNTNEFYWNGTIATASHGTSADWKQAFDWGNYRQWGLGIINPLSIPTDLNNISESGMYSFNGATNSPFTYGNVLKMRRSPDEGTDLAIDVFGDQIAFRGQVTNHTPWRYLWHTGNLLDPATKTWVISQNYLTASALNGYVLQSSLNTQLASYATLAGTQTFTGTNTFTQSPVVPNGTLNGHTVNLGQMQSYVTSQGYQNASQVTAIVNSAVSAIPAPGNGSVVIQGINALTGTATFSMNQSNNVVGSFDLTASAKADISEGKQAGKQISDLFGSLSVYPQYHDVSGGSTTIDPNEAFFNLVNPKSTSGISVEIINHSVNGARLVLQGVSSSGSGTITYTGRFIDRNGANINSITLDSNNKEYYFDTDADRWREVF